MDVDEYIVSKAANHADWLKFKRRCKAEVDLGDRWPEDRGLMHQCRRGPKLGGLYCHAHRRNEVWWRRAWIAYRKRSRSK